MKKMVNLLRGRKSICFLDFEGTQFTHEMIAIGAVMARLDRKSNIKKMDKPFRIYVRAKNRIGKVVVNLTGITEETIKDEGVAFSTAMKSLAKYCGKDFKKCIFATFGSHDIRIINQSVSYNMDAPMDITKAIISSHVDMSEAIAEFVKDENGNPMSLVNYCKLFVVPESGKAHDPAVDALNLANLYQAFISKPDIVFVEYKKVLQKLRHLPEPVTSAIRMLSSGNDVTSEQFDGSLKDYLR